jgi:uncharacterized hydantoinase/oxoprolinase family protein
MAICRAIACIDADELSKRDVGDIASQLAPNITEQLLDDIGSRDTHAPN